VAPGGITLNLTGASSAITTTDSAGAYSFTGLPSGSYTVTPSRSGLTFQPPSMNVTVTGTDVSGQGFAATGFTLLDALTGPTLDGSKFRDPLVTRSINPLNGGLELWATGSNLESSTVRGVRPTNSLAVSSSGALRVTSWGADITVPAGVGIWRTGTATIQSAVVLAYQPLANRLAFPGGQENIIVAQLGLQDTGAGLTFFRNVSLCTNASCSTLDSATNIVYYDGAGATALPVGEAASRDTAYTFLLTLDEPSGTFTYTISGGTLGTRTGTANATALFAAQSVNPQTDFLNAQIRTRVFDPGVAGGSSGMMMGLFDNVQRGNAGAVPTLYDSFASPTIDPRLWGNGEASSLLAGSGLLLDAAVTSPAANTPTGSTVALNATGIPRAANQVKVDVTVVADSPDVGAGSSNRFGMHRTFYNDGSNGAGTAPNVNGPDSMVGDVFGQMILSATSASFDILRSTTSNASANTRLTKPGTTILTPSTAHPLGVGTTHTLYMAWNPATHTMTFQLDDAAPVVVDPTSATDPHIAVAAPVVQAKRVDFSTFFAGASVGNASPAGAHGSISTRLANVYFQ
jgi:hypothetical protein